jgi:hypothetical protein
MATPYPILFNESQLPPGPTVFFRFGAISKIVFLGIDSAEGRRFFFRPNGIDSFVEVNQLTGDGQTVVDVALPHDSQWVVVLRRSGKRAGYRLSCVRLMLSPEIAYPAEDLIPSGYEYSVAALLGPAADHNAVLCVLRQFRAEGSAFVNERYSVSQITPHPFGVVALSGNPTYRFRMSFL